MDARIASKKCYRTTREILSFASQFYQLRLPNDEEAMIALNLQPMPHGSAPIIVALASEQDELSRVTHEIQALITAGIAPEHILVLHTEWQGTARMLERLRKELGEERVANPRELHIEQRIRVCSLDAATGLESPIVFLMGTHRLCEAENSLRLSEEERLERIRDTTRRLYMAMTRAGQRLVMTYVGQAPAALAQALAGSERKH